MPRARSKPEPNRAANSSTAVAFALALALSLYRPGVWAVSLECLAIFVLLTYALFQVASNMWLRAVGTLGFAIGVFFFAMRVLSNLESPTVLVNVTGTNDSPIGRISFRSGNAPVSNFRAWYYFIMTSDRGHFFIKDATCANLPTLPSNNTAPAVSFALAYPASRKLPVGPISSSNTIDEVFVYYAFSAPNGGDEEHSLIYSYDGSLGWQADMVKKSAEPMRTLISTGRRYCNFNEL